MALLRVLPGLAFLTLLAGGPLAPAIHAREGLTEAQAKAGFLYNCAMFVSWPWGLGKRELRIGVLGDDAVSAVVQGMHGQRVDGRTIYVEPVSSYEDLDTYQILFVAGDEQASIAAVLRRIGAAPVLTVGESDDFTARGGVVRLYMDQGRLRFEINMTRVERAGLKVSAKMLGLARIVR